MQKFVSHAVSIKDILNKVTEQSNNDKKVEVLQQYNRPDLKFIVELMYATDLEGFKLPEFKMPNKPFGTTYMTIRAAIPKMRIALANRDNKRVFENNMIRVLESLSTEEVEVLVHVLNGKKIEGISKSVFKKVYPQFFRD
jgi:hypothetical protein